MDELQRTRSRTQLILTLVAAGVFFAGAALIPLLVHAQENALQKTSLTRAPFVLDRATPILALTDLQGSPVSLADMRGKVVLVNNWATWCPPCQAEMPELQAYYLAHARQGFLIVAIESGEPPDIVDKFISQYQIAFPIWLDPHGSALDSFKNWDLPSSYVVNRQGKLIMNWTGPIDRATLEKYVTPQLEK
jgi:thiol-disulfide isomerase/thioredoxin